MSKLNEMSDDYANGGYRSMTVELPSQTAEGPTAMPDGYDTSVVMGAPTASPSMSPSNVTVYANSITPVSYGGDSTVVAFD